jgi:sec-independent protein translocase protein TatB
MFDIGFWEICLVVLVALLVFGPENLPQAARTAGMWVGRARRMVSSIQQEIDRELHLQEMRDAIKQNEQMGLHQFLEETKSGISELEKSVKETTSGFTTTSTSAATTTSSPIAAGKSVLPSSINNPISPTHL